MLCCLDPTVTQWLFASCFLITSIVSWVLRDYGTDALNYNPVNQGCLITNTTTSITQVDDNCLGQAAVIRIGFGNFIFFALQFLLLLGVTKQDNIRTPLFTAFWPVRLIIWGGLIASTFAMPASVFDPAFVWIARVASGFFILIQLIILLDFIYIINEYLLERDDGLGNGLLIGGSALLIIGSIIGTGFLYYLYSPSSSCSLNIFFITWNLIMFLIYGSLSISPLRNESAGLLTSAVVFAYNTYYVWSALNSEPPSDGSCTPDSLGGNNVIQIIGFVLALLAVAFSTARGGASSSSVTLGGGGGSDGDGDKDDNDLPYRPDFFCMMFLLASCYVAVLLTGWDGQTEGEFAIDTGWGSTWVKIVASWVCALMYTWSLIAHHMFNDRVF